MKRSTLGPARYTPTTTSARNERREAERLAALQAEERRLHSRSAFEELARQAETAVRRGRWGDALAAYDRALELESGDAKTWNDRGHVHSKLEHWDAAASDYGHALELTTSPTEQSLVHGNRAFVYRRLGREEEALAEYNRAVELDGTNMLALYNRGFLYFERSQEARFGERKRFCELAMADLRAACDLGDEDGCQAVRDGLNLSCRLVMH
jgi:Flp pilus assembly protein TadD